MIRSVLLLAASIAISMVAGCVEEQDSAEIIQAVDKLLDTHKMSADGIQIRIDNVLAFGDAAVPHLVDKFHSLDNNHGGKTQSRRILQCLCALNSDISLRFVRQFLVEHTNRWATAESIKAYPIERDEEIRDPLIALLKVDGYESYASERLQDMIRRTPATAGFIVSALVDDPKQEQYCWHLGEILAHVAGYAYTWGHVPSGQSVVSYRNLFWREWWDRNKQDDVFGWLAEAVQTENDNRKQYALGQMCRLVDERAIPFFLAALDSPSDQIQFIAVGGLKMLQGSVQASGYPHDVFVAEKETVIEDLKQAFGGGRPVKPSTMP